MNYQKMILGGRLTRDPQLLYTKGGRIFCKFGIGTNRKYKEKESACFFDVTAWGKVGETIAEYLKKGNPILIEGHFELNEWEDKNGGGKRQKLELIVEKFSFVGSSSSRGEAKGQDYDNIPF